MEEVARGGTAEILEHLHRKLDVHFHHLSDRRQRIEPASPVFALEHDLSETDLYLLKAAVRESVWQGFSARSKQWWLPFVVYAAEVGYDYVGDEYWQSFEAATPAWDVNGDRGSVKIWFKRFADEYGGAVPTGAWAESFTIICWPITHAVLPTYLQRQLAQLLFEYRTGLTTGLLSDPVALGARLAARTGGYADRFRTFCQNTNLLGQVAAALLSGDDEESPYLLGSALHRLVDGVSSERQSRLWLHDAKRAASRVRSNGFRSQSGDAKSRERAERLPAATDPKLFLRKEQNMWRPYVALPDLTPLQARLPHVYDELRSLRARVAGAEGRPLATGRLLHAGQEVALTSWPRADEPFIQLERGSAAVNALIADQCVIGSGPWWVFRIQDGGPAVEVKGTFVRPGHSYCVVGHEDTELPRLAWMTESSTHVTGMRAFELHVPRILSEDDTGVLTAAGISVLADVVVRPVGLVASAWDGEGAVEWLAGEPAMVGIRAERAPDRCVISIDGEPYVVAWPQQEPELFLAFEGLEVGTHDITATLLPAESEEPIAGGSLLVIIHDPQVRPAVGTSGEGIRLLASPARPRLAELWDQRASLTIEGPPGTSASLSLTLYSADGDKLTHAQRRIGLPVDEDAWKEIARREFRRSALLDNYDAAESCEVTVSRGGLGFASLTCERGFRALRWVVVRQGRRHVAQLIDKTDGNATKVELFPVESPVTGILCSPNAKIELPSHGGLVQATSGSAVASIIYPSDRNQVMVMGRVRPTIQVESSPTSREVVRLLTHHRAWLDADLRGDPFAEWEQSFVLDAITRALVSLIGGHSWSRLERALEHVAVVDRLEEMQKLVGEAASHRFLAKQVADHLWKWADSADVLTAGFVKVFAPVAASFGIGDGRKAASFLLALTRTPGLLTEWDPSERDRLIKKVLRSPALIRAARFAVLGAEAFRSEVAERRVVEGSL